MPAISTNDLKNGITLEIDKVLYQVVEFQHCLLYTSPSPRD